MNVKVNVFYLSIIEASEGLKDLKIKDIEILEFHDDRCTIKIIDEYDQIIYYDIPQKMLDVYGDDKYIGVLTKELYETKIKDN